MGSVACSRGPRQCSEHVLAPSPNTPLSHDASVTSLLALAPSGEQVQRCDVVSLPRTLDHHPPKLDAEKGENVEIPGVKEVGPALAPADGEALSDILGNWACRNAVM